jgi:hypothetical protein
MHNIDRVPQPSYYLEGQEIDQEPPESRGAELDQGGEEDLANH